MQSRTPSYYSLKAFVDTLGGSLDDEDINAAADVEGGKDLLAWLVQQAAFLDIGEHATLRELMLEKDEIPFHAELLHDEKALDSLDSKTYMPPSKLQKEAAFIKEENDLMQRQINALTLRISKTKEASKALVQSIKSLQRVVCSLDAKMRTQEETITELSFDANYTVATTISSCKATFRSLDCFPAKIHEQSYTEVDGVVDAALSTKDGLASARAFLLRTRNRISSITGDLRNSLDYLSNIRKGRLEKIRDIENEASRLQAAFHAIDIQEQDVDVETDLRNICLLLEQEASRNTEIGPTSELLKTLLSEADDVSPAERWADHRALDVQAVLHDAWERDQIVSSQTEKVILDTACNSLTSVIEPLQSLRSSILPLVACIREVEVVVEAFIEELANIALPEADDNSTWDLEDTEMEENLRRVLNRKQDTRPAGALPLVLMSRDDILAELQEIRNRTRNVEKIERARIEEFVRQTAVRPLHAALPQIYANSPLHSSPPFSFPPDTQDLEACVRKMAEELQAIADSVEEEFKSTFGKDSNMKRLDAFVEKWTRK